MVIELITSITLLQTSFSLHRANPSEGADTSFQTSEPSRAYKHRDPRQILLTTYQRWIIQHML